MRKISLFELIYTSQSFFRSSSLMSSWSSLPLYLSNSLWEAKICHLYHSTCSAPCVHFICLISSAKNRKRGKKCGTISKINHISTPILISCHVIFSLFSLQRFSLLSPYYVFACIKDIIFIIISPILLCVLVKHWRKISSCSHYIQSPPLTPIVVVARSLGEDKYKGEKYTLPNIIIIILIWEKEGERERNKKKNTKSQAKQREEARESIQIFKKEWEKIIQRKCYDF